MKSTFIQINGNLSDGIQISFILDGLITQRGRKPEVWNYVTEMWTLDDIFWKTKNTRVLVQDNKDYLFIWVYWEKFLG